MYCDRTRIIEGLENLREDTCCYMGSYCDCKYGRKSSRKIAMEAALKGDLKAYHTDRHGEQTGCPELRCALAILRFITDEEYAEIMGRPHRERVFTAAGEGI